MKSILAVLCLSGSLTACCLGGCNAHGEAASGAVSANFKEVVFPASDGHNVYADFYPAKSVSPKAVVLMFHQAGSNSREYATIAPKIAGENFDCIAVDQRSGGDMWDHVNRTVNKSGAGDYLQAYNDLVGALKFAITKKYSHIIVWGSSYSAALVFKLASENPRVDAVIAFSPGEYMDNKSIVQDWARKVTVPVFFACTQDEWSDGRSELFDAVASKEKTSFALAAGVHGSSTLIPDKSTAAAQYWSKVNAFLSDLQFK